MPADSFFKWPASSPWSSQSSHFLMPAAAALHLCNLRNWIGLDGGVSVSRAEDEHMWRSKPGAGWDSTKLPTPHHFEQFEITRPDTTADIFTRLHLAAHRYRSGDRVVLHVYPTSVLGAVLNPRVCLEWFIEQYPLLAVPTLNLSVLSAESVLLQLEDGDFDDIQIFVSAELGVISIAPTCDLARLQVERLVRISEICTLSGLSPP